MARLRLATARGGVCSQSDFAAAVTALLGSPFRQTRLSRLESNEAEPTLAELIACAEAANTSAAWLAFGFESAAESPAERGQWLAPFQRNKPDPDAA